MIFLADPATLQDVRKRPTKRKDWHLVTELPNSFERFYVEVNGHGTGVLATLFG